MQAYLGLSGKPMYRWACLHIILSQQRPLGPYFKKFAKSVSNQLYSHSKASKRVILRLKALQAPLLTIAHT